MAIFVSWFRFLLCLFAGDQLLFTAWKSLIFLYYLCDCITQVTKCNIYIRRLKEV